MEPNDFLAYMQRYVANVAISNSTLRNQGGAGVIAAARRFLAALDLSSLRQIASADYPNWLDHATAALVTELHPNARRWGTARKALNVFLVQASLNRYLYAAYFTDDIVAALEVPLDSQIFARLKERDKEDSLPPPCLIRELTPVLSAAYQEFALRVAKDVGVPRPYLDVVFWRSEDAEVRRAAGVKAAATRKSNKQAKQKKEVRKAAGVKAAVTRKKNEVVRRKKAVRKAAGIKAANTRKTNKEVRRKKEIRKAAGVKAAATRKKNKSTR